MSDRLSELTRFTSEGGIAATHPPVLDITALVGSSTGNEHNVVRAAIIPVACWRLEDVRFEFDSSVVVPEIELELKSLAQLVKDHPPASKSAGKPGFPLSVFGHADPVGNDDYNKQLSGRRAIAIYALLTRDTNMWERLFSEPLGNDKWGRKSLEIMLDRIAPAPGGESNQQKAIQHERSAGLRRVLFGQYMEALCGSELKLKKDDFLGHGDDAGGKGDFQGCSEFNPVLIFSQKDQTAFEQDQDKTARNDANASNRRVMVLIFRKGSRVSPSKWPCPRANEGVAGCKNRFWSDAEQRRSRRLGDKPRKFEETLDTFACRFYHRLVSQSPCERLVGVLRIRLYDGFGQFISGAPFTLSGAETPAKEEIDRADTRGIVTLRNIPIPAQVTIRWGFPPEEGDEVELLFSRTVFVMSDNDRSPEASKNRLKNLGYDGLNDTDNVIGFQLDYGALADPPLEDTGEFDDRTRALVDEVHRQSADRLRETTTA
jgi:hypothetical protein